MNSKSVKIVMIMVGMSMVPNFCIYLPLLVLKSCCHSLTQIYWSYLPCGISVGEQVFSLYVIVVFLSHRSIPWTGVHSAPRPPRCSWWARESIPGPAPSVGGP